MTQTRKGLWRFVALLLVLALVGAACGDDDDEDADAGGTDTTAGEAADRGNVDGVLKIGYLLPSTGDLSFLGPPMIKATEMAIADVNEAGGVLENEVQIVGADDGTDEDVASQSTDRLLETEQVDAIVGAAGSSISLAVIDKITGAEVVQCSPSNTGAEFTEYDDGGYYFRTAPPDTLQGPALADVITGDGHEEVAIIGLANEYGRGFGEFLKGALEDAGATVSEEVYYDPKGTSFDADVQQIADADPQAIALIAYPDTGGQVIASMIEQGIGPDQVPLYVTDGMQASDLYQKVDPNNPGVLQGVKGTAPSASPSGGAPDFGAAFKEFAPGTDTIFSAHAYDCAVIIALAAAIAESDDPSVFVDEVVGVTKGGTKCNAVDQCLQLIADGEDIDYDGAAGPLDFIEAGEPGAGEYDVYEYGPQGDYEVLDQISVGDRAAKKEEE